MKISVVVISYNQGNFLEETISSVINQNYDNKEVIVIDGGSTDNSVEIIKKHVDKIDYWVSEKDEGQSDAILKGFNLCSGDIITWINSDDLLCEGTLEQIAATAKKHDTPDGVFYGNSLIIDELGGIQEKLRYGKFNYDIARILGPTLSQPGTFFGREVYHKVGGLNKDLRYGMDLDLFCKFLFNNIPFIYVDFYTSKFRKYATQKGHSEKFLKICEAESQLLNDQYGFSSRSQSTKNRARRIQIRDRILNGYYITALVYRLKKRGSYKEFNTQYSD